MSQKAIGSSEADDKSVYHCLKCKKKWRERKNWEKKLAN